jgi:hypothetical protein
MSLKNEGSSFLICVLSVIAIGRLTSNALCQEEGNHLA